MPSFLFWSAEERLKRPLLDLATFDYTSNRSAVLRLACVQLNGAGGGVIVFALATFRGVHVV